MTWHRERIYKKILFSLTARHWPATGRPPSRRREGLWFWSARTRRQILLNFCQWSRANLDCSSLHQRNNVGGGAAPELALSQAGVEWRTLAAGYARESERVSSPSPAKFISLMALPPSRPPALLRHSLSRHHQNYSSRLWLWILPVPPAPTPSRHTYGRWPLCDY